MNNTNEIKTNNIKQFITINGKTFPCHMVRGMYQIRFNRDGFHINIASKNQKDLKKKFIIKFNEQEKAMRKTPFIKDYAIEWLQFIKHIIKKCTYEDYLCTWRTHIIPAFGQLRLDELTRKDIQNYLYMLTDEGKN